MGGTEFVVDESESGARLDVVVGERCGVSRTGAQRMVDAGAVTVDGESKPKRHRVSAGERVEIVIQPEPPAPTIGPDAPVAIAYEDEYLMVVDKPAGLVVHPAPGHRGTTLVDLLKGIEGGSDRLRPGIVHRLDRDTSGLMVVAKSQTVHAALERVIRERALHREYLALVEGRPDARSGTIDAPIGRDRRHRTAHSTRTDRPRAARTHFVVERLYARTTLLRVRLETGRTHQIRVHLAAIGHPVCGDAQYGGESCGRRLGLERQFLHSTHLAFAHPISGEKVRCESNLPVDLRHASDAAAREPASEGPDGG